LHGLNPRGPLVLLESIRFYVEWPPGSNQQQASKKFTTISGSSASQIMIWVTSIWKSGCSNRPQTSPAQSFYPCGRYILLRVCPGWTHLRMAERRREVILHPDGHGPGFFVIV
jgi:hypothetical protein